MLENNLLVFTNILNLIILGLILFLYYRMNKKEVKMEKFNFNLSSIDPRSFIGGKIIDAIREYIKDINKEIKSERR